MNIDIIDINQLISTNKLPQVTSSLTIDRDSNPFPDGLLSYEIFGRIGTSKRKFQCAYINLKKNFFHPVIYRLLIDTFSIVSKIINGQNAIVNALGNIELNDDGENGVDFFYNNWEKINWIDKKSSESRKEKLKLLEHLKKNEIFCNKWLVIPPFYRDLDRTSSTNTGIVNIDELTSLYAKLIKYTNIIDVEDIMFSGINNIIKIQNTIYEIYEYLSKQLAKKNGIIHKKLLGKSVDYPTRTVISAPPIDSETYDTQQIPMGYIGLPLHITISLFYPFVMAEIQNRLINVVQGSSIILVNTGKENPESIEISNYDLKFFSEDNFEKLIKLYSRSIENRNMEIMLVSETGEKKSIQLLPELKKTTLMDLLFVCAYFASVNKFVVTTRYPLEDFRNIIPLKVKILVTEDTQEVVLADRKVMYPVLSDKTRWIESTRINNYYHSGLGSDFDGDMVSTKALFSQEANDELERLWNSNINLINIDGSASRDMGKELIQSFFNFTRIYE